MRRQGDGLDHAVAERFFGSRKGECTLIHHCARRQEARDAVIESIEMCYNSKRLHSYLGDVSPHAFEGFAKAA
jgi:putative transposase